MFKDPYANIHGIPAPNDSTAIDPLGRPNKSNKPQKSNSSAVSNVTAAFFIIYGIVIIISAISAFVMFSDIWTDEETATKHTNTSKSIRTIDKIGKYFSVADGKLAFKETDKVEAASINDGNSITLSFVDSDYDYADVSIMEDEMEIHNITADCAEDPECRVVRLSQKDDLDGITTCHITQIDEYENVCEYYHYYEMGSTYIIIRYTPFDDPNQSLAQTSNRISQIRTAIIDDKTAANIFELARSVALPLNKFIPSNATIETINLEIPYIRFYVPSGESDGTIYELLVFFETEELAPGHKLIEDRASIKARHYRYYEDDGEIDDSLFVFDMDDGTTSSIYGYVMTKNTSEINVIDDFDTILDALSKLDN